MVKKMIFAMILVSLMMLPTGLDHTTLQGQADSPVLLGIYPNGSIGTGNHEITELETYLGEDRISIAGGFLDFEEPKDAWITSELDAAWDNGFWPLINISAGQVDDAAICPNDPNGDDDYSDEVKCTAKKIASGDLDPAIRNWAQIFNAWSDNGAKTAYLAPLQEMNGNWVDYYWEWDSTNNKFIEGDPQHYIDAYTRIQSIFNSELDDPSSVIWVFAPNGASSGTHGFEDYYPGDTAIDVVGFSSFNWGTCFSDPDSGWSSEWETYDQIYLPYLDKMATMAPAKPIFIMEMASHTEGGDRVTWFDEALTEVGKYTNVDAVLYFNRAENPHNPHLLDKCNVGTADDPLIDYSLDYDGAEGKATFKNEVTQSPYGFSAPTTPEMDVQGGGQSIADGDIAPSTADDTDFGNVNVDSVTTTHTFTVENTGTANLHFTGSPKVEIVGTHAVDFSVTADPAPNKDLVDPSGGSTTFEVTFDPSAGGVRTAEIRIPNDDSNENPYTFAIQGTGIVQESPLADFDGDGDTDISVYRPSNGKWYVYGGSPVWWGLTGDLPVPGDYDGDGVSERAVFRPSNGKWYVYGESAEWWGLSNDVPVQGDYDGDGITDLAVFRPSNGKWYVKGGVKEWWGLSGDIPVPGDYDGDGTTDLAVYRPSNGYWYVKGQLSEWWGLSGDIPVPGDYDGDGTTDLAVYRPSNGYWYVKGQFSEWWGLSGDIPVPGDYDGNDRTDIAVLRPSNGKWYIKDQMNIWYYLTGDYPLPVRDTNADGDPYQ